MINYIIARILDFFKIYDDILLDKDVIFFLLYIFFFMCYYFIGGDFVNVSFGLRTGLSRKGKPFYAITVKIDDIEKIVAFITESEYNKLKGGD